MVDSPFISIVIPNYNRFRHLQILIESVIAQKFTDFEICISDGGSTEIPDKSFFNYISKHPYIKFETSSKNLPYDSNLRKAISMSRGKYVLLMGNDDKLINPDVLEKFYRYIKSYSNIGVIISNYYESTTGNVYRRAVRTANLGSGPHVAASNYSNCAFVSGIVFDGRSARGLHSNKHDGAEMYQMYLASGIISSGLDLHTIDETLIYKDIIIENEFVDSFERKARSNIITPVKNLPLLKIPSVVIAGMASSGADRDQLAISTVLTKFYIYTYPFWVLQFKKNCSLNYALQFIIGSRPSIVCVNCNVNLLTRIRILMLYIITSLGSYIFPVNAFEKYSMFFHRLAKRK